MILILWLIVISPFSADKVEIINEGNEQIVKLLGNVIIEEKDAKITCYEAVIYEGKDLAVLNGKVKIADTTGTIEADTAYHYLKELRSILKGNVVLKNKAREIYADSLVYTKKNELAQAYGRVRFVDTAQKFNALGKLGTYDLRRGKGRLEGTPQAFVQREGKSPIEINSKYLEFDERLSAIIARDSVKVQIDSLYVTGDTLTYYVNSKTGLITNLNIVERTNTMSGLSGRFTLRDSKLDEFEVSTGQGVYHTEEGTKNEITGGRITFKFKDGKTTAIEVVDSPEGLLFLKR